MHQYVTGHWAASSYDSKGGRSDHLLSLSLGGTFEWNTSRHDGTKRSSSGTWSHGPDEDVLIFRPTGGDDREVVLYKISYVSGCEDSNVILVLRWLALASRNLPILFTRIHPPDDPVWQVNDDQHI
jgi:hypothetical protein